MKPRAYGYVGCNGFVAVQAKLRLSALIKRRVAILAVGLQLAMCRSQISWHHQLFKQRFCRSALCKQGGTGEYQCKDGLKWAHKPNHSVEMDRYNVSNSSKHQNDEKRKVQKMPGCKTAFIECQRIGTA